MPQQYAGQAHIDKAITSTQLLAGKSWSESPGLAGLKKTGTPRRRALQNATSYVPGVLSVPTMRKTSYQHPKVMHCPEPHWLLLAPNGANPLVLREAWRTQLP